MGPQTSRSNAWDGADAHTAGSVQEMHGLNHPEPPPPPSMEKIFHRTWSWVPKCWGPWSRPMWCPAPSLARLHLDLVTPLPLRLVLILDMSWVTPDACLYTSPELHSLPSMCEVLQGTRASPAAGKVTHILEGWMLCLAHPVAPRALVDSWSTVLGGSWSTGLLLMHITSQFSPGFWKGAHFL